MDRGGDTGAEGNWGGKSAQIEVTHLSHVANSLSGLAWQDLGVGRGELQVRMSIILKGSTLQKGGSRLGLG